MAGPFYNGIKGTTAGTPGTGAFTPNAASSGFLAWSTVPTGWIGMVRYEDGSAWELQYCYWNGTTLSRAATTQFVSSSSGSALTLTSAATAAMVADADQIAPHLSVPWSGHIANVAAATFTAIGSAAIASVGTLASQSLSSASFLDEQKRVRITSVTTVSATASIAGSPGGICNSTAGRGGWEFAARFGPTQLPTAPRAVIGMQLGAISANEPSAAANGAIAIIGKDSTDTNLQFMTNANTGGPAATKIDTGIPLAAGGAWYSVRIWCNPGSLTIYCLLIRLDSGAIFYRSTATNTPITGSLLVPQVMLGLSATTGTAAILHTNGFLVRTGGV